ncbi:MAG: hypothetical protein ACHQAY_16250 [Hyphomicrobiales bacterium]
MRRVCVTSIVNCPHSRSPNDGQWNSTGLIMAILVAALAAAMVTLGAMLGFTVGA